MAVAMAAMYRPLIRISLSSFTRPPAGLPRL